MRIIVLTILLTLTACSALFGIKTQSSESGNLQIAVDSKNMFGFHSKQPTSYLSVYYIEGESKVQVWHITSKDSSIKLGWVTYGQVPDGFNEQVKAKELVSGKEYLVGAHGPGWWASGKFHAKSI